MPPKETKQTPSNTLCFKGSQAGWGTDGKVHCFKPTSNNIGNTSTYPTGGSHGGGGSYSGGDNNTGVNSGSYGGINTKGGSYSSPEQHIQQVCASLGGNVLGGAYHDGRKNRDEFGDGINYQVKSIVSQTNYYGFKNPKGIVLSDYALEDRDIAVLTKHLQCHRLDLDVFDVSNNKIGLGGVKNLFCGLRFDNPLAGRDIITMNFSNNVIGDDGAKYMADCLKMGRFPNLKNLDVSGNQITATGYGVLMNSLKKLPHDIILTLEKYSTNLGQKVIKPALKHFVKYATEQGVDTTDVATNKGGIGYLMDTLKIIGNIAVGVTKCSNTLIEVLLLDTTAPSMIKGFGLEVYGSTVAKKVDFRVCVALEVYDGIVSTEGVDLAVKAVDIIGDN